MPKTPIPTADATATTTQAIDFRYVEPGWFAKRVFDPMAKWLVRRGVSLMGARILEVRGRTSGEVRSTVVNLLEHDGDAYLVAPRGTTQWVRNLRVARVGVLRIGARERRFEAVELADRDKLPILGQYLRRWGWEVGKFFEGLDKHATEQQLREIASSFPVFRISID